MSEFKSRKSPRLQRFDYNRNGTYFITVCTQNRNCILSRIVGTGVLDCPKIKLTEYGKIAEKNINKLNNFYEHIHVDSYVIMPNHIHMLLSLNNGGQSGTPVPTNECGQPGTPVSTNENGQSRTPVPTNTQRANSAVSQFISTFKRICNKEYGENVWQARFYDHIIRSREDYEEHLRYIYENPKRWYYDNLYIE